MSLTATKRHMNWTGVSFTPTGGSVVNLTGVTSVRFDSGGSLAKFSGDGDRYNTTVVNDHNEPTATVTCADLAAVNSLATGQQGTFVATHNDAKNGTSTGAITYTLTCVVEKHDTSGSHRQFGQGNVTFVGYSADGQTNPLSTAIAS